MLQLGLIWGHIGGFDLFCSPHCGAFDIRVCQIPIIAPYNPEGGVVGEYIDRCIMFFADTLGRPANSSLSLTVFLPVKDFYLTKPLISRKFNVSLQ